MTFSPGQPSYPKPLAGFSDPSSRMTLRTPPRWQLPRGRAAALAALGLLLLVVVAFPLLGEYLVRSVVLPRVGARLGCTLSVSDVQVRPSRVVLRWLRVRPDQVHGDLQGTDADLLLVPRLEARYSPYALLLGRVRLGTVRIDQAILQIVRSENGEDNVSAVLERLRGGARAGAETAAAGRGEGRVSGPERVVVQGAVLDVRDDFGSAHVAGLDADLRPGGKGKAVLSDATLELAGGARAQVQRLQARFATQRRPGGLGLLGLPEVEVEGGSVAPWKGLALTGISGEVRPDGEDPSRALVTLHGGYGGVDRTLWDASGWLRPGRRLDAGVKERETEAEVQLRAARFQLSSLDPILKNTPVIESARAQLDARLDLHYAHHALDFDGSFNMSGLSLFTPRLAAEPVRGLGFTITAGGRIDPKARRYRLDHSLIRWRGLSASLEVDAEAQPAHLRVIGGAGSKGAVGVAPNSAPGEAPGLRERWRSVSAHLQVPPVPCQTVLDAMPPEVAPKLHGFKLAGNFYTDLRVGIDFAQLLRLPPAPPAEEEEIGADLQEPAPARPAAAALAPARTPAMVLVPPGKHRRRRGKLKGSVLPPLRTPHGEGAMLPANPLAESATRPSSAAGAPGAAGGGIAGLLEPVTLGGHVGIEGCKVLAAPEEMSGEHMLESFTHLVEVEPGQLLSFVVGPENPDFVPYADLSPYLINSIMTTEDNGFMKHHGFIGPEFRSALRQNLERGYFRLGASSITMQMVKNVLLSREKTLSRKLQELFLTWYLEQHLTKERILEIYFNVIEFGPYLYGIGKAARHYFGKSPKELTPREAAWFSSILPNPKRRYIHFCRGKPDAKWEAYLNRILRRVHERGRLTDEEFNASMEERLTFGREEATSEKECLALIKRLTEPQVSAAP